MAKLYYSIKEVSRQLGEPISTLKYWEREFPHLRPRTTAGGTRQYTQRDVEAVRTVQRLLRDRQLTIEGAQSVLRQRRPSLELRENSIARLEASLEKLKALHRQLLS